MKSWRVTLPYVCIRDAIVNAHYTIHNAENEIEAIKRAAISLMEDHGCYDESKHYIRQWQRAQAGEPLDYEDLVPAVFEVK